MTRLCGSVVFFVILLCFAPAEMGAQGISVLNDSMTLSPGDTSIEVYFQTPLRPIDKPKTSLVVTDLTTKFDKFSQDGSPQQIALTRKTLVWRTVWKLGDKPPLNRSRLVFLAQWDDVSSVLTININKEDDGPVRFDISSASLRTRYEKSVKIQAIANYSVTNPVIDSSSLADSRTGRTLTGTDFQIATCTSPSPKPNGSSQQIVSNLCLTLNDGHTAPGKYDGALVLGTTGRANLGSVQLTVYSTSVCAQLLGVLCLFLGLLCFFVFSVVIKGYNRWLLALLPARRLFEAAVSMGKATAAAAQVTKFPFPQLLSDLNAPGSLVQLQKDLSQSSLRKAGYLPSVIANPFVQSDLSSDFRVFLTVRSAQIESLKLIVDWGVASVMTSWKDLERLNLFDRGREALSQLDSLAIGVGGPLQMLASQIQSILNGLQTDMADAHKQAAFGGAVPDTVLRSTIPSAEQITIQLEQLSIAGWVLWASVTLLVGSCALVWFNDGFGIGRDYLQCFLWGVGIPSIAQGFGGLTANSVTSAFSLQIPR